MANELNKISALDLSNVATCRIENTPLLTKNYKILKAYLLALNEKTRVRLIGIDTKIDIKDELNSFFDLLDTFRGIDQNNVNVDKAQVEGDIEITSAIAEHTLDIIRMRYPYIRLTCTAQRIRTYFKNYNGTIDLYYDLLPAGEDAVYVGNTPTKPNDGDTYYSFVGWSNTMDSTEPDAVMTNITTVKVFYPAFADAFYVTFMSYDGSTVLDRQLVISGETAVYGGNDGDTDREGYGFVGWSSQTNQDDAESGVLDNITGATTVYASYKPIVTVTFMDDTGVDVLHTASVIAGTNANYLGQTPTTDRFEYGKYVFVGWNTIMESGIPLDNCIGRSIDNVEENVTLYPVLVSTSHDAMQTFLNSITDGMTVLEKISLIKKWVNKEVFVPMRCVLQSYNNGHEYTGVSTYEGEQLFYNYYSNYMSSDQFYSDDVVTCTNIYDTTGIKSDFNESHIIMFRVHYLGYGYDVLFSRNPFKKNQSFTDYVFDSFVPVDDSTYTNYGAGGGNSYQAFFFTFSS